ncbi:putative pyrroloquinoline-quinone binding quinoprotein [Motilibacter peucedani]|uniref:Putative pyrroloquinoline-quinone binding quinoprotein n=1 Tax=Motilibacter peucedani TaxID=598650 RepID=A0A420XSI7_9ACTN|nr:putative pyrroloquinoline-quinone binding quinoprotein [Motilibacter peucedani]
MALAAALAACSSSGGAGDDGAAAPVPSAPASATSVARSAAPAPSSPRATAAAGRTAVADWPTYHGDPQRTGVGPATPRAGAHPRAVHAVRLDGQVYASPIAFGATIVVATEANRVYALDSDGRQQWRARLGRPASRGELPCGNIDPLGITGTPVYDAATSAVLVAVELGSPVRHELVSLDAATGRVRWRHTLDLPGVETRAMQQRGALTLSGGRVWVPFGGLAGDCGGYKGRVVGIRLDGTGAPVSYTVPTGREGGIWTPPGPSVDAAGHLYVAVGNGESGRGDAYDFSDSVLELDTSARLLDSYSPSTWASDNAADLDLGSQGPALVGTRWVFSAGKSGTAYVLRQGRLGGIGGEVSHASVCRSFGGTAVVGSVVYVPCTDGVRAVAISPTGRMAVRWHAEESVSGSPVVAYGRVWSLDTDAGLLHALDPATGRTTASVRVGDVTRFATPAVHAGLLLVPTTTGLTVVSATG